MNRRIRQKQDRRREAAERLGTEPTPHEISQFLPGALRAAGEASCVLSPGVWQPAPVIEPEPDATNVPVETVDDESIVCEEDPATPADQPTKEDETDAPFLLAVGDWEEREPVLFDRGPDPHADVPPIEAPAPTEEAADPFEDLLALAETVGDGAAASIASVTETDPDLRALVLASYDTLAIEAMALGELDAAKSAFEHTGGTIRTRVGNLRARLATPRQTSGDLSEDQRRDATIQHLRRAIVSLVEEADGLGATTEQLERLAVDVGNGYRAACADSESVIDQMAASWPRLNVTVSMHRAAKPDADAEAVATFRAVARQVLADDARVTAALEARAAAEERIGDMHRAWHEGRSRALEIRKNLQGTSAACQLLGIPESTFDGLVDAGLRSCRTNIAGLDAHKSLVAILPVTIPEPVEKTRALLPQIRELLERLGRQTNDDLGQIVLLGYHLVVRDRRGKSVKGVCRVLVHAGLLAEADVDRAIAATTPLLGRLFDKSANERFDLFFLNDTGRRVASGIAARRTDLADLEQRVAAAKAAAKEEQIAIRDQWKTSIRERTSRNA